MTRHINKTAPGFDKKKKERKKKEIPKIRLRIVKRYTRVYVNKTTTTMATEAGATCVFSNVCAEMN